MSREKNIQKTSIENYRYKSSALFPKMPGCGRRAPLLKLGWHQHMKVELLAKTGSAKGFNLKDKPFRRIRSVGYGLKCCMEVGFSKITITGRKSVWNHVNNGSLCGLQKREYLAKHNSLDGRRKQLYLIF